MTRAKQKLDPSVPNVFVRSGLFSVKSFRNIDRPTISTPIFTNDAARYRINFDGFELNQDDYEVFASLLRQQRFTGLPYGSKISIPVINIVNDLCWEKSGQNYKIIWAAMRRLRRANVTISTGKAEYDGSLILEIDKDSNSHVTYSLSKNISDLFDDDCTYVELSTIVKLKRMMSKWLFSYYRSHSMHIPIPVTKIREMMRVPERMKTKEFNRNLRDALSEVAALGSGPFVAWTIENDVLSVAKSLKKPLNELDRLLDCPDLF